MRWLLDVEGEIIFRRARPASTTSESARNSGRTIAHRQIPFSVSPNANHANDPRAASSAHFVQPGRLCSDREWSISESSRSRTWPTLGLLASSGALGSFVCPSLVDNVEHPSNTFITPSLPMKSSYRQGFRGHISSFWSQGLSRCPFPLPSPDRRCCSSTDPPPLPSSCIRPRNI